MKSKIKNEIKKERHKVTPAVFVILEKGTGKSKKILLSRRFNTGHKDGFYSFPSGHLERGESVVECIIREAKEEVGIIVKEKDLQLVHISHNYYNSKENNPYVNFYFISKKWSGELKNCEPEKCDELVWCAMNKLPGNTIHYVKEVVKGILNKKLLTELREEK